MKITCKAKHIHIAPRKCRKVADLMRGMEVVKAQFQLKGLTKRSALPILKLLNSAIASAEHNYNMVKDNLYVSQIFVDGGVKMKRWSPRAFGRAFPIVKNTSHITIVLEEKIAGKKKIKSKKEEKDINNKKKERKVKEGKKFKKDDRQENKLNKSKGGVLKRIFQRKSV